MVLVGLYVSGAFVEGISEGATEGTPDVGLIVWG
jgi:hypothetical protein